mmetsp:Transcript_112826/g.319585  ORF Transcript_112826/g.319585 Transcript_112826/m.319585 type:complete len:305 (-) Transcript_112826:57-971(-)
MRARMEFLIPSMGCIHEDVLPVESFYVSFDLGELRLIALLPLDLADRVELRQVRGPLVVRVRLLPLRLEAVDEALPLVLLQLPHLRAVHVVSLLLELGDVCVLVVDVLPDVAEVLRHLPVVLLAQVVLGAVLELLGLCEDVLDRVRDDEVLGRDQVQDGGLARAGDWGPVLRLQRRRRQLVGVGLLHLLERRDLLVPRRLLHVALGDVLHRAGRLAHGAAHQVPHRLIGVVSLEVAHAGVGLPGLVEGGRGGGDGAVVLGLVHGRLHLLYRIGRDDVIDRLTVIGVHGSRWLALLGRGTDVLVQ